VLAGWVKVVLLLLGTSAVAGLVAVVGLPSLSPKVEPPPAIPVAPVPVPPPAPKAEPAPATAPAVTVTDQAAPPVFDVVRVEPTGDAVVAGRAAPGAVVELLRNGAPHDRSTADAGGQFAMVPPALTPGTHDLSLVQTLKDGRRVASVQSVTVSVPDKRTGEVVVALAAPNRPTQLLTPPLAASAVPLPQPVPGAPAVRAGVAVLSVEAEDTGRLYATGSAAAGAHVRLYLNDTYLATATASPEGRWSFTIRRGVGPGSYRVRADDVDLASGRVLSRAEVPFEFARRAVAALAAPAAGAVAPVPAQPAAPAAQGRPPVPAVSGPPVAAAVQPGPTSSPPADAVVAEIRTASVTRGDSLWRISKRVYGDGLRYTVIYTANAPQIREPNLIYPGQVFVLPTEQQP